MVGVEKHRQRGFLARALHQSCKLPHTEEVSLTFGYANEHRNLGFIRSSDNSLQRDQLRDIEMTESCTLSPIA